MSVIIADLTRLMSEAEADAVDKKRLPKTFWQKVAGLIEIGIVQHVKSTSSPRRSGRGRSAVGQIVSPGPRSDRTQKKANRKSVRQTHEVAKKTSS